MKIKNGIIKNINTKLLSGALALVLTTTGLSGCSNRELKYEINDEGKLVCVEDVAHKYILDYKVVVSNLMVNNLFL